MKVVPLLKVSCLGLFLLSTTALVTAIASNQWVVNMPTQFGPTSESLWTSCNPSGCSMLQRETRYMFINNTALILAAMDGVLCIVALLRFTFCHKTVGLKISGSLIVPAIVTLICMSVYTWVLTKHIGQKYRGWSFYLGWVSFPLFLIAGVVTFCFQVCWETALEESISSLELHARAIDT